MGRLLNFAMFYLGWFACVMGAGRGELWLGPSVVAALVLIHLSTDRRTGAGGPADPADRDLWLRDRHAAGVGRPVRVHTYECRALALSAMDGGTLDDLRHDAQRLDVVACRALPTGGGARRPLRTGQLCGGCAARRD